ncbi:MAG: hypothetical protein WDW36_008123 [Sanguina aurantia]
MSDIEAEPQEVVVNGKDQQAFADFFKSLPQDLKAIRFFDRKSYYTVHGETAFSIARQYYRTTAVVKTWLAGTASALPYVCFNHKMWEGMLREILLNSTTHTVELFEGSGATWKLTRAASPGRLTAFDEELFRGAGGGAAAAGGGGGDVSEVPVVVAVAMAVLEGQRNVGVAFLDGAERKLGMCEFVDDEGLAGLEAVLVQLGAKEVVVMKELDALEMSRLSTLLSQCGAMATARPRNTFATKHLDGDLAKLIKGGSVEQHRDILERRLAASALAAVIAYSELLADGSAHGKHSLGLYDPGSYMRLDATARKALNVMPSKGDANVTFSLYGLMNRGRTAMGKRLLKSWLKQPLVDVSAIRARHDMVEAMTEDPELRGRLRDQHLRGLPDIDSLTRKLEARRIGLADLHALYRASAKLPLIVEALAAYEGPAAGAISTRYCQPLSAAHGEDTLVKFEELLEAALDLDRLPEEYLVSPEYDTRLAAQAEKRAEVEAEIQDLAQAAATDLGFILDKTIKLDWHKVSNRNNRCLRITNKEEKNVRQKLEKKYTALQTLKDGVKFSNKALMNAAERLNVCTAAYDDIQRELVAVIVGVAASFVDVWKGVSCTLAELDVLAGFADLSVNAPTPYVRPVMEPRETGVLVLKGARHPCVELQDGVSFMPNDCVMERGSSWFHIITGPNMGGKSTYIRQVGVAVLMAQVGCFVAAESARLSVRDAVFARVGAGDCQTRGVSTFMAEMLETAAILKSATPHSLVIIDELGRGTSTYDGFGLAWAISEHLTEVVGAPTLFATHFHELTQLTSAVGVRNMQAPTRGPPQDFEPVHPSVLQGPGWRDRAVRFQLHRDVSSHTGANLHARVFLRTKGAVASAHGVRRWVLDSLSRVGPVSEKKASILSLRGGVWHAHGSSHSQRGSDQSALAVRGLPKQHSNHAAVCPRLRQPGSSRTHLDDRETGAACARCASRRAACMAAAHRTAAQAAAEAGPASRELHRQRTSRAAAAEVDPVSQRLTMLYHIREGACDQSFGIHVAASSNFPPEVVALASAKLKELESGSTGQRMGEAQAFAAAGAGKRKRTDGGAGEGEECQNKDKAQPQPHSDNGGSSSSPSLDVVVREFLSGFADLPLPDMEPAAASAAAAQLLQKLESHAARLPGLQKLLAA